MPHYQCTRCPRSSLVKSNFKFTPQRNCVCVVCWDLSPTGRKQSSPNVQGIPVHTPDGDMIRRGVIEAMGGMNARPTYSEERSMLEREYRHAGERFDP